MTNKVPGQRIIEQLFEAIDLGDTAGFQDRLAELKQIAASQQQYANWYRYFQGVMYKEQTVEWAQAERIFTELLQDTQLDPFLHGQILLSLANTYFRQGLWIRAIQFAEETASLFQESQTPEEEAKAWLQIALAHIKGFEQGDFNSHVLNDAVAQCRRALDVLETVENPSPTVQTSKAVVWNSLGLAHRGLRNWTVAIHCFQQFLEISQNIQNTYYAAFAYCNLGEVYQRLGAEYWSQAHSAYRDALAIFQRHSDRYQEIEVLANLGYLHQEQNEYEQALAYYDRTFQIIEQVRARNTSEENRAKFFATVTDAYANAVLICLQQQQAERAFTYVEQARSRAFLDFLDIDSSTVAQAMMAEPLTPAEIQRALPHDALLLEYYTTGLIESRDMHMTGEAILERRRFPGGKTIVFAITHDDIAAYDTELSPNHLYPNDLEAPVEDSFLSTHMRRMLYKFLIEPCAEHVAKATRLYIVPHGPLHYIPFQALIGPDEEQLLQPDGPQIIYAPSAAILLRHTEGERHAPFTEKSLRRFTDIRFPRLCPLEVPTRLSVQLTLQSAQVGAVPPDESSVRSPLALRVTPTTGEQQSQIVEMIVMVSAEGFAIDKPWRILKMPLNEDSELIEFELQARHPGEQVIEVEFYHKAARVCYVVVETEVVGEQETADVTK